MKTSPLVGIALAVTFVGCAPFRPYDPAVAEGLRALGERTEAVVEDGDAGRLSLNESRRFLRASQAEARFIRARVDRGQLNPEEGPILTWLDNEYTRLLRRPRPLRGPTAVRLQNTLATLQILRPVHAISINVADFPTSADTSLFDSDTAWLGGRDDDRDRHRHDHGDDRHDNHHDSDHDHDRGHDDHNNRGHEEHDHGHDHEDHGHDHEDHSDHGDHGHDHDDHGNDHDDHDHGHR